MTERIGESVRRELARFGPQAGMAELVRRWPAAVGEAVARQAWPARFQRDGTLVVHATDAVWAYELAHHEADIRDRLGELVPAGIRFVPGPLPEPAKEPDDPARAPVEPEPGDLSEASRLAGEIRDEELRNLVQKAVALSLARARSSRPF